MIYHKLPVQTFLKFFFIISVFLIDLEDIHNEIRRRTSLDYFEEPADDEFEEDSGEYSDDESNC